MKTTSKIKKTSKIKSTSKIKTTSKIVPSPQICFAPSPPPPNLKEYYLTFFYDLSPRQPWDKLYETRNVTRCSNRKWYTTCWIWYTWLCACARIQKRQYLKAKTTIVKLYIYMNSCPQNKIDSPLKKKKIHQKKNCAKRHFDIMTTNALRAAAVKMPMLELHTAPALSRIAASFNALSCSISVYHGLYQSILVYLRLSRPI